MLLSFSPWTAGMPSCIFLLFVIASHLDCSPLSIESVLSAPCCLLRSSLFTLAACCIRLWPCALSDFSTSHRATSIRSIALILTPFELTIAIYHPSDLQTFSPVRSPTTRSSCPLTRIPPLPPSPPSLTPIILNVHGDEGMADDEGSLDAGFQARRRAGAAEVAELQDWRLRAEGCWCALSCCGA